MVLLFYSSIVVVSSFVVHASHYVLIIIFISKLDNHSIQNIRTIEPKNNKTIFSGFLFAIITGYLYHKFDINERTARNQLQANCEGN
jgi:hypothetical protein